MPGACGLTHQPTTPPASLATPHEPFGSLGLHDDRRDAGDRPVLDLVFSFSAVCFSLSRLPCSNQNRVMSISPAGLAACQRHTAPTNVLWMSSGSAPTVLARMSSVSTSHSFSRLGYCFAESSLRGTSPDPDFAAVPSTVLRASGQQRQYRQRGDQTGQRPAAVGGPAHFAVHNRLAGQFLGHITGIGEWLLGEADRPLDEVVLELDADLAEVVADGRVRRRAR